MRKRTYFVGVIAAAAGLIAVANPAIADSADNDGIHIGNGNNVSVAPVQLCGNNVAVVGAVAPVGSPQSNDCVNAPIGDHPSAEQDTPEPQPEPQPEPGPEPQPEPQPQPNNPAPEQPGREDSGGGTELPTAPSPVSVSGHHAVTG